MKRMRMAYQPYHRIAFPVKPRDAIVADDCRNIVKHHRRRFAPRTKALGGFAMADSRLIVKSSQVPLPLMESTRWEAVRLPRPGCGVRALSWKPEAKPIRADPLA
jgi:hypothetical protein